MEEEDERTAAGVKGSSGSIDRRTCRQVVHQWPYRYQQRKLLLTNISLPQLHSTSQDRWLKVELSQTFPDKLVQRTGESEENGANEDKFRAILWMTLCPESVMVTCPTRPSSALRVFFTLLALGGCEQKNFLFSAPQCVCGHIQTCTPSTDQECSGMHQRMLSHSTT